MKQKTLTREQLYELVWAKTMARLEIDLGTNIYQIKKICKQMKVPVPVQGYWSKLKHKKDVSKPPLTNEYDGDKSAIFPLQTDNTFSPQRALVEEIESDTNLDLAVPEKLTKSNNHIQQVRGLLSDQKVYEGLKWSKAGYLNINVSPKNVNRALRIMNSVMQILEQRGHTIEVKDETIVWLFDYDITMRIFEARKKEATTDWRGYKFNPTGKLKFQYGPSYWRREIMEGTIPLENQLARIIAAMETFALKRVEERRKTEAHFQKLREEKDRLQVIQERKDLELEKVKQLISDSILWEKAAAVRKYIEHLNLSEQATKDWIDWAKEKADWMDPSVQKPDDILSDEDRVKM